MIAIERLKERIESWKEDFEKLKEENEKLKEENETLKSGSAEGGASAEELAKRMRLLVGFVMNWSRRI